MLSSHPTRSLFALFAVTGVFILCVVKLFGTTVSSKFNMANDEVSNEVSFGGGGGSYFRTKSSKPVKRVYGAPPARVAPPAVVYQEPPTPEPTTHFTDYGVNHATSPELDRFSTFSVDVDTGSYTLARAQLNNGQLPDPRGVRVEEFVNYFDYDYARPKGGPFTVNLEAAPSPFNSAPNNYLLQIGLQGKELSKKDRKPAHLTFLMDVSGSMADPQKLPMALAAMKTLVRQLKASDTVAIVTYASSSEVVLTRTKASNRDRIYRALDQLRAGGGTQMGSGMEMAYRMAFMDLNPRHNNRVIVVSDGDANIGATSHTQILDRISKYVRMGVTLSTIGVGMGNYRDTMMEQLADKGNGNYYYVDSSEEAQKVFSEQADGTLQVIAKDVKIQVEFDPEKVKSYRLLGYENRQMEDHEFRDDKKDAGEIGAGHSVTAFYEVELFDAPEGDLGNVRLRAKTPTGDQARERVFPLHATLVHSRLSQASDDFVFASAVAQFAEVLRESPYADHLSLELVKEVATTAADTQRRDELLGLVDRAIALKGRQSALIY